MKKLKCPKCEKPAKRMYTRVEKDNKDTWQKTEYVKCEAGHVEIVNEGD